MTVTALLRAAVFALAVPACAHVRHGLAALVVIAATGAVASANDVTTLAAEGPIGERMPASDGRVAERARFVAARQALADGDRPGFLALEATLTDYPLYDFLVHERLLERWRRGHPTAADVRTVEAFETASGDAALTRRLVRALQVRLAEKERWEDFLALGESRHAASMPCTTLRAREATAPLPGFDEQTLALWIAPTRHDAGCRTALDALEARATARGTLPLSAYWERIYAAMEADRPELAEPVLGKLGTRDRRAVEGWISGREDPVRYLAGGALDADKALNRRIIADLVLAWSKEDTVAAMDYWLGARERFSFSDELRYDTHRALAMRGAYRRLPEAVGWLDAFEAREDDLELMEWRVRVALLAGDWDAVRRAIARLPPEEQKEDHWAYWEARALELDGRESEARAIRERLAGLQSWHGFLSAERLGRPHAIENVPIRSEPALLERLAADPALVRAREFHLVGLAHEGRREWNTWLEGRREEELAAAAELAAGWGLADRAIFSAGRADRRRALTLRFPVLYAAEVSDATHENRLDPAWVYGVMRRESAYIPDIRSSAGAIGLMQLMPSTATYVAKLRGEGNWRGDLTDPATNIAFGTFYLRHVLDRFDDHEVLATASYNAGPNRVAKWLPERGSMEADRWIDTIPYTETRRYVRAVFAYAAIYERRLTGKDLDLGKRLRPVPAAVIDDDAAEGVSAIDDGASNTPGDDGAGDGDG